MSHLLSQENEKERNEIYPCVGIFGQKFAQLSPTIRNSLMLFTISFVYIFIRLFITFHLLGLRLQGARCHDNQLELTATISTDLSLTSLKWIRY